MLSFILYYHEMVMMITIVFMRSFLTIVPIEDRTSVVVACVMTMMKMILVKFLVEKLSNEHFRHL